VLAFHHWTTEIPERENLLWLMVSKVLVYHGGESEKKQRTSPQASQEGQCSRERENEHLS
jgi:hypothetical protein